MEWMRENFQWLKDDGVDKGQKFLQGMQVGAALADRRRSMMLQEKKFLADQELAERDFHFKQDAINFRNREWELKQTAQQQKVQGYTALGEVMSKWSQAGKLDDPAAEAEFWQVAAKYPFAMDDASFNQLGTVFQRARDYKNREKLLATTIEGRKDVEGVRQEGQTERLLTRLEHLSTLQEDSQEFKTGFQALQNEFNLKRDDSRQRGRLDLLDRRFEHLQNIQGDKQAFTTEFARLKHELGLMSEEFKQDGRMQLLNERFTRLGALQDDSQAFKKEVEQIRHDFGMKRDAAKATAKGVTGATRFDLLDSDRIAYQAELKSLQKAFEDRMLKGADGKAIKDYGEYQKIEHALIEKYRERARKAPATAPKVEVVAPDRNLPANMDELAEKHGFKVPQEDKRVRVKSPDGKVGSIPESQLEAAKKAGFTLVE